VNVATASIMVIEQAESFGLAQLHQLRGRVGRGSQASTCLLMYGTLGQTAERRLKIMRDTDDGFKISEEDLKIRGAGDVLGVAQSGLPKFQIADIETQADLMKTAQDDARLLLTTDPDLQSERGIAARTLLYLMEQDKAIRFISVG
jgi:ATP-dependent DNA helicase RecG